MLKIYSQNVWNSNPTEYRNELIRSLVEDVNADVCFFQECGPFSIRIGKKPLQLLMSDKYAEACQDVAHKNYTPVFYKKERFNLLDCGYFLYDGLNDYDSKSVSFALLEDKITGEKMAVASTHFWWKYDSENDNLQRLQNVQQLKECCDSIIAKYSVPVIVGGDFNNGENAEQGDEPYKAMLEKGFVDIRLCADKSTKSYTHHDYPILKDDGSFEKGALPVRNLDYIFVYGKHNMKIKEFDILISQKALDSSDHCPLIGCFESI